MALEIRGKDKPIIHILTAEEIRGEDDVRPTQEICGRYIDYMRFREIVREYEREKAYLSKEERKRGSILIFTECTFQFGGGEIERFADLRERLKRIRVDVKLLPTCIFRKPGNREPRPPTRLLNKHERVYAFERIQKVDPDPGAELPATFLGCVMSESIMHGLLKRDASLVYCIIES